MTGHEVLPAVPEADRLRQQLYQAQRLTSVGALASSMAHEFNNVLTTVINYAKLGQRCRDDDSAKQAFEKILKAGHRAATIVNSMLGFARNGSGEPRPCDAVELVESALALTEKDLVKHRVRVEKTFHGRPELPAVAEQIEQIFVNLIINARQAMPDGGRLTIDVRDNVPAGLVEFRFRDTGAGIPPEELRRIFEPFYTTKTPDEDGHGGSGLGLSVCRQIVEQHHGRIRVESISGRGSTFTVKLPAG